VLHDPKHPRHASNGPQTQLNGAPKGKSMAALIDLVRSGRIAPGSRVLYAHLGGQLALNAYAGVF
jgi:hypothetical protein